MCPKEVLDKKTSYIPISSDLNSLRPKGQNSRGILVKGSGLTHLGNGNGIESFLQLAKKLRSSLPILTEGHLDKATDDKNLTNFY